MAHSAVSDLVFHCLQMSHIKGARLKWINLKQSWSLVIKSSHWALTSFLASGDFCRLLITFGDGLDEDQD